MRTHKLNKGEVVYSNISEEQLRNHLILQCVSQIWTSLTWVKLIMLALVSGSSQFLLSAVSKKKLALKGTKVNQ